MIWEANPAGEDDTNGEHKQVPLVTNLRGDILALRSAVLCPDQVNHFICKVLFRIWLERVLQRVVDILCGVVEKLGSLGLIVGFDSHLLKLTNGHERLRQTAVGVEEGNQLGALEMGDILARLVKLKKDLEGSAVAIGLELAPEAALVAADAVHEAADVAEAVAKVLLEGRAFAIDKHGALVKDVGDEGGAVGDLEDLAAGRGVLLGVVGAKGVGKLSYKGAELGDGAGDEGVVEVEVADAVGVAVETVHVAGQVGAPEAGGLVEVVPAEMGADAGVHSGDDPVEDALLETLVVGLEAGGGDKGGVGLVETLAVELGLSAGGLHDMLEVHGRGALGPLGGAQVGRVGEGAALEAVFAVDGVPDLVGAGARVAGEALGVLDEAHVVALGKGALVLGDAVVALVALVVVVVDAALADGVTELAVEGALLLLGSAAGVLGQGALELGELADLPDVGDVVFVVEGLDGASYVAAEAILVVPKGTGLVEEVEAVVGEEVGGLGEVIDGGLDAGVELVEGGVGDAGIVDNGLGGDLQLGRE